MPEHPSSMDEIVRCIDESGKVCGELPGFANDLEQLKALYEAMVLTRVFDEKAVALQRTGRLGTYASSLGQEAVGVGTAAAMQEMDVLLPSFREQGAMLWRGVSMSELLLFWGGDERGSDFRDAQADYPICIPVGTHYPHAAGTGFALKYRGSGAAAVAMGGDGSTSRGDFYEAMNICGAWRLPVVFVVSNNQWAISVPRKKQSAASTLSGKSVAAGITGRQVDGNDVLAVRLVVASALERARAGEGATLIEAVTYRLGDHTTADDATRYRSDEEVSAHWRAEPLARLRTYLEALGEWSRDQEEQLLHQAARDTEAAVESYLQTPPAAVHSTVDYLYASMTPEQALQREKLLKPGSTHD